MLLALLKYVNSREVFDVDEEVCKEVFAYAEQVAEMEMKALVTHPALRLPVASVNPQALDQFDIKTIATNQRACAPMLTSMLYMCAGIGMGDKPDVENLPTDDDEPAVNGLPTVDDIELGADPAKIAKPRGRDRKQVATVSLCMLCYTRNQQSNVLQMTAGYSAYADNMTKRSIEIFHRMGFMVTYETVRRALSKNASAILELLAAKAWKQRFFLSFDNMNFYEHRRDERLHNKGVQVAYTAGYVCFMRSEHDKEDATWDESYLRAKHVDYQAVNQLVAEDFALDDEDFKHHAHSARYIISNVLGEYFPVSIRAQTIRHPTGPGRLPKYRKWSSPLPQIRCRMEKADLLPLPTLALDEASIMGTIDILKVYLKVLELKDFVVRDKCIMFKGDFLTVRNMRRAVYRRLREPKPINRLQFIEPIAGLFHLQMNVLKLFLNALWGRKQDRISLARFQTVLGRTNATPTVKDFHASDDFFRTIVKSFAISLCMHDARCPDVAAFKLWLSGNDWPKLIQNVEQTYLGAFKFSEAECDAAELLHNEVSATIAQEERDWKRARKHDRRRDIITSYMVEPDWQTLLQERLTERATATRDIIRENALRLLNLGLLYLDFVDACREGYSGRVEKCIQCFALVFQGSYAKNYAGECLHLVACLKRVWKPEFRRAWLDYCLINPSGMPGKFYADDRFGETIVKLNKEKVRPSANAKTDKFLREVVAPNVLTLWKSKEVMSDATGATDHGNRHSVVETYNDVKVVIDLLSLEKPFEEKPGRGSGDNPESETTDLFGKGMTAIASGIPLRNYIRRARGNWGKGAQILNEEGEQPLFEDDVGDLVQYIPPVEE